jgi:hypothetical protein
MDTILTRHERENLVLDLYFNQNKNTREISQEAKMSFREIGSILDKARKDKEANKEQTEKQSLSTQAYRLFSEGNTPTQIAIALNIRQPEVTELQKEYWKLNQLYDLDQIYEETKDNFSSLVGLYRQMKTAGMNVAHVIKLLGVVNNDIQSIEHRCQELRREAASLEAGNRNAARTFEQLSCAISETQKTLDHYESLSKQQRSEMDKLFHQKTQLEEFIECFKNSNTEYVKVKENIKREVEDTLTNSKKLIRLALLTLIESSRKDIDKFRLLCYQMSTDTMVIGPSQPVTLSLSGDQNYSISNMNEKQFQDYNDPTEAFQNFVLDEAEKLYDKLIDDSLSSVMNQIMPY